MRYFSILLKLILLIGFVAILFSQGAQAITRKPDTVPPQCPEGYTFGYYSEYIEHTPIPEGFTAGIEKHTIIDGFSIPLPYVGYESTFRWSCQEIVVLSGPPFIKPNEATPTCEEGYDYAADTGTCNKNEATKKAEEEAEKAEKAKKRATFDAFEGRLDDIKTRYCYISKDKDCESEFHEMVSDCFTESGKIVNATMSGASKEDKNDQEEVQFSRCLADKTKLPQDKIAAAVDGFDFSGAVSVIDGSKDAIQEQADKAACDSSGGTWDSATKTCTPPPANDKPSCTIDGVGWIVCPTINFLAGITDASYGFLADNFLNTPASLFQRNNTAGQKLFEAWQAFLNLANALLVIGFLMVVFSQISGIGISNYGIKKMLPKIILAAVLINTSFYICALAVDLSNIIGYTSKDFLDGLVNSGGSTGGSAWSTGGGFAGIAGTVLAGGVAVAASGGVSLALVALMSVLASGAIALIMIFFILTIRQVVIILLVVLAPLAFVSMFLPNTEKWFRKWREVFTGMLLLFPIVGIIYGASLLSQDVISSVYVTSGSDTILRQIVTAAMMILPLYLVPIVLKKSLNSIGDIGGKLSGIGGKMSGKVSKGMNESQFAQHQRAQRAQRQAQIRSGTYSGRGGKFNPRNWRSGVHRRLNSSRLFNTITSGYGDKMGVMGASVAAAQDKEAMEAANASISAMNLSSDGLMSIIKTGEHSGQKVSSHQRRAAIQQLAKISTGSEAAELARMTSTVFSGNSSDAVSLRKEAVAAISQVASKAPYLGGKSLAEMQAGTYDEGRAMDEYMQQKIKAEDFKSMDANIVERLNTRAMGLAARGYTASLNGLNTARATLLSSPELKSQISAGVRDQINKIGSTRR